MLELVIALAVGGIVVLLTHAVTVTLADAAERVVRSRVEMDSTANALRSLRQWLLMVEGGSSRFTGLPAEVSFTTWCVVPAGWLERCSLVIAPDTSGGLIARPSLGEEIVVLRGVPRRPFLYLTDPAHGGTWFERWGQGVTVPAALGIVTGQDTVILRLGSGS